jgi:sigma-70-like protein
VTHITRNVKVKDVPGVVPKPRKQRNYINNPTLLEHIINYQSALRKNPNAVPSNYIGEAILLLSNKYSNRSNFSGYSWKDEFVADAIENCVKALRNFDPTKSNNPFAYLTTCVHNAFIRRIQKEKKQQYIKLKLTQHHFIMEGMEMGAGDDHDGANRAMYENNDTYIQEFEASMERKKAKKLPRRKARKKLRGIEKLL